jgi:hypothetical protein
MSNPLKLAFKTGALIGRSMKRKRLIWLKDPRRSTYVVGAHGMGKSTLLMNLILSDIERGDKGVVVMDPHGDLARAIALRCPPEQAEKVIYFAPAEQTGIVLGLNPFQITEERSYELQAGALMDVFAHAWYGDFSRTPTMQNTLETLVRTLLIAYPEHETSFLHMLLLTRQDEIGHAWRARLAPFVEGNPALAQNWAEWENERRLRDDIESSRQKIKHIVTSDTLTSILSQPTSANCFRFQELLSQKGVLLVNLEGLEDEGQRLIGSIILTQLLVMAKLRMDTEDRVPCHIYADEFYKFSPQAFVTIINEARKFRLFCTLAHQNLEQLDKKARAAAANCGNVIAFRVNPEDSSTLGRHFLQDGHVLPADTLSNLPRFHAMIRYADRDQRRQAFIRTFGDRGVENQSTFSAIRKQSEAYGRPIENIRSHITDILEMEDDRTAKRGQPPIRTKPKTASD